MSGMTGAASLVLVTAVLVGCSTIYGPAPSPRGEPAPSSSRVGWRFRDAVEVQPGDRVERPQVLSKSHAQYTEEARKQRLNGYVELEVELDETGAVVGATVLRSLDPGLDAAAVDAARRSRYSPARLNGTPRASVFGMTISFQVQ